MKRVEQFKKELFTHNAIPQNSDNEMWFNQIVDDTIEFAQRWIKTETELPEQYQLVIAKYDEDTYAIARFEDGCFLTAYPVSSQPLEWRQLEYK